MSYQAPWYVLVSEHSRVDPPQGNELRASVQVPRNVKAFRHFCDSQGGTATLGVMMALVLFSFPATLIYLSSVDPSSQSPSQKIMTFFFSMCALCMGLFLSSGAYPALQRSRDVNWVLKQNLPALIINSEGIWDYSSSYIFGFVAWEEIETVMLDHKYSPEVNKDWPGLSFIVKNKEILLCRKSALARFWLNKESTIADRRQIFIPQEWIDIPIEDLIKQIEKLRPETLDRTGKKITYAHRNTK